MCWFSTQHANKVEGAKACQRLAIRQMHWGWNWAVRETEFETPRPCAVCLKDGTRVLFRFSEDQQASLHFGSEADAVFRMLKTKQDVFEFAEGVQRTLDELPAGLIFDVLIVPGSEELSAVLNIEQAVHNDEERAKETLLARLITHF